MLIQAYELRVLRCASCGGPVAGTASLSDACEYCGADTTAAVDVGAFSHDIRVVACSGCAAPMAVPIEGGRIGCLFCNVSVEFVARREAPLGSGGTVDDPDRIARLRSQDRRTVRLEFALRQLVRSGSVVDSTRDEAEAMWTANRKRLGGDSPDPAVEKRFFLLTELLADYHNLRGHRLVARGLLEAALSELRTPRYLQSIYAWLSRNAAMTGDPESARAWLELCDPAPEDLEMDSAVRFTWASLALRGGDLAGVRKVLGATRADVPLLSKYDDIADLSRAHVVEQQDGPDAATAYLRRAIAAEGGFAARRMYSRNLIEMVQASPELSLCKRSMVPAVEDAWPWWPKPILAVGIVALIVLAVATDALLGPTLWGERVLGYAAIPISIVTLLFGGAYASGQVEATLEIRRRLREFADQVPQNVT